MLQGYVGFPLESCILIPPDDLYIIYIYMNNRLLFVFLCYRYMIPRGQK